MADITDKVLALGKLVHDYAKVTRIPRHADGRRENDVEHSFMLAMVAPAIAKDHYPELNIAKIIVFALVHDLPEVKVGDVSTFNLTPEELAEKQQREQEALDELLEELPPIFATNLAEYERQDTPEAVFVRTVDKLLPISMDIVGSGSRVIQEDHGIRTVESLVKSHAKLHDRLSRQFGDDFPELISAHAVMCGLLEQQFEEEMAKADIFRERTRGPVEIERKFVVDLDTLKQYGVDINDAKRAHLRQGYVAVGVDGSEVRIRSINNERFELTAKTPGMIERGEMTVAISSEMFEAMWQQTAGRRVEKTRYYLPQDNYMVELDVYKGHLSGLATAEVEFGGRSADANVKSSTFIAPEWFGEDVSEDRRYKNQNLAKHRPHQLSMLDAKIY